ncbi:hypothetical protein [Flavimaricola marinus]|uniref:Prophage CP4-57 regulatory protein (AlpA) n=1 Tax=Flavimaricola marinus TaxID=1819565 RepID=A0A238LC95_9RHOB|nr:hypothetical protein [Flavimaricola marinus]SMY07241.1 hypothetical protein LOM8899_01374 [Flavimaricola marinus]
MIVEIPQITPAFIAVSIHAHEVRRTTYILPRTVAILTNTSEAYWDALQASGKGPQLVHDHDYEWYVLAEVQEWLDANVCSDRGTRHD